MSAATVDVTLTRSGEFMVTIVEGQTDAGVEFVDRYVGSSRMVVHDAGRIVVPDGEDGAVVAQATSEGLTVERVTA